MLTKKIHIRICSSPRTYPRDMHNLTNIPPKETNAFIMLVTQPVSHATHHHSLHLVIVHVVHDPSLRPSSLGVTLEVLLGRSRDVLGVDAVLDGDDGLGLAPREFLLALLGVLVVEGVPHVASGGLVAEEALVELLGFGAGGHTGERNEVIVDGVISGVEGEGLDG